MKEFLEKDFLFLKKSVQDVKELVFKEDKKGFNNLDCLLLLTFSMALDKLLEKLNKEINLEEKDERNN